MAITINKNPLLLLPALQPSVFELESDSLEVTFRIKAIVGSNEDSVPALKDVPVTFEISDYLKVLFPGMEVITAATPQLFAFAPVATIIQFCEVYGDPPAEHNSTYPDTYHAMLAKIPESRKVSFYKNYTGLFSYLTSSKSLLSWWPSAEWKKSIASFPEFIYYIQLHDTNPISIALNIDVYFSDGTEASMNSPYSAVTANYTKIYYFPVGYTQLGIAAWAATNHAGKTVTGYSIQVMSGVTPVSALYKYKLDAKYYQRVRQLWFRNPFGVYETSLLTGSGKVTNEIKPDNAQTDALNIPGKITWKNTLNRTVSANSGFLSELEAIWLSELLDTTEVLEWINGALHPVVMKDIKIIPQHDNEFQFSSELEWEYCDINYTETF